MPGNRLNNTIQMDNIIAINKLKEQIKSRFACLQDWGLIYSYSEEEGVLKDRLIHQFCFDNTLLKRKIVIVYCEKVTLTLQGFILNYKDKMPCSTDYESFVAFDRLRILLDWPDMILYGNAQYEIPYKIEEIYRVAISLKEVMVGEKWIDFERLKKIEASKNIYYEINKKRANEWIVLLSQKLAAVTDIAITYNPVHYPPYEHRHLQVANQYGTVFRIGYGHFNRDESGYVVHIMENEKIVESKKIYDSRDMDDILVDFLRKKR